MKGVRNLALTILFSVACVGVSAASDIYVSQNASGSNTGADCAHAHPVSWFNAPANWGGSPNQIGPGTTVHLCGVIAQTLGVNGNGSSGSPITLFFESGAKVSTPASPALVLNGHNWITVDGGCAGGCNGILENTANGTGLANQVPVKAIDGTGSGNIEVRNLLIQNFYVHSGQVDTAVDATEDTCYYANGTGPLSIHDNTMHDIGWCIETQAYSGSPIIDLYNNNIYNVDHGIAIASSSASTSQCATVNIHSNHVGSASNWDTAANSYHHDGIHLYNNTGSWPSCWAFNIYDNLFDGNWGINNTAHIFTEEQPTNLKVFNNVFIQAPGNILNNGFLNAGGLGTAIYNNTFVGAGMPLSICVNLQGTSLTFRNNLLSGCNRFLNVAGGVNFANGGLGNNIYAAGVGGGNTPFSYGGSSQSTFSAWQSATQQDASPSVLTASANLGTSGSLQSGSVAIGIAANLSGLGLAPLNSDTTDGNSRPASPRPSSGMWDVGAFAFGAAGSPPTAPSGLTAAVQ